MHTEWTPKAKINQLKRYEIRWKLFTQSVEEKGSSRLSLDGKGAIIVNGRDVKDYFTTATLH